MKTFRPPSLRVSKEIQHDRWRPSPALDPKLARWHSRRAVRARWGPVTPAQRLIWRDKDL